MLAPAKKAAAAAGEDAAEAAAAAAEARKRRKAVKSEVWENWLFNSGRNEQLECRGGWHWRT